MRELLRQVIHLVFGLGIAALVLVLDRNLAIAVLSCGLLIGVVLIDLILRGSTLPGVSWLLRYLDRSDPLPGKGAFFFVISALACVTLFPAPIVVPALVTLAVLDSVSTLVGKRYGQHRIYNGKSWEGTLSGFVIGCIVLLPFLPLPGILVAAATAAILELFSPVDDNLVIPYGVCIVLSVFPWLR